MIDEFLNPWLIEVNTNPCLAESSGILRQYLPRMLDDAFKLTLDVAFPCKIKKQQTEKVVFKNGVWTNTDQPFEVDGYDDNENMWQYI